MKMDSVIAMIKNMVNLKENDPKSFVTCDINKSGIAFYQVKKTGPKEYHVEFGLPGGGPYSGNRILFKDGVSTSNMIKYLIDAVESGKIPEGLQELA